MLSQEIVTWQCHQEDLKDYEKELLNYNTVAKDKIAVMVNQKNPLSDITLYMLKSIYTGGVKNWEDLQ